EQRLSRDIVLLGHAPIMPKGPHEQVPSIEAFWKLALRAKVFCGVNLRLDPCDDGFRDFILDREHVGEAAVLAFSPKLAAGGHVAKPHRDADARATLAHAPLNEITDAEFLGDLLHRRGPPLVSEG